MIVTYTPVIGGLFGMGAGELMLLLAVLILLFGAKKLPELAKGLGKSVTEFKKAAREAEEEEKASEAKLASKPTEPAKTHGHN